MFGSELRKKAMMDRAMIDAMVDHYGSQQKMFDHAVHTGGRSFSIPVPNSPKVSLSYLNNLREAKRTADERLIFSVKMAVIVGCIAGFCIGMFIGLLPMLTEVAK